MFSSRFKSVAAMAGWDEEALLLANLVVEDTPKRNFKDKKKRSGLQFKTPSSSSRRFPLFLCSIFYELVLNQTSYTYSSSKVPISNQLVIL